MGCGVQVKKRVWQESEEGDFGSKKIRSGDLVDLGVGDLKEIGGKDEEGVENLDTASGEADEKDASCNGDLKSCDAGGVDLDLNIPCLGLWDDELHILADRKVEVIDISSADESEDEVVEIINSSSIGAQRKQIEDENSDQCYNFLDLLGFNEMKLGDERRYTREEKGKGKVFNSWLSLACHPYPRHFQTMSQDFCEPGHPSGLRFEEYVTDQLENQDVETLVNDFDDDERHEIPSGPKFFYATPDSRHLDLRKNAHTYAWVEGYKEASSDQQKQIVPDEELLVKSPGPFSTALKIVRERSKRGGDELIRWQPSNKECNVSRSIVPSLLDLCLKVLAEKCEAIVSLGLVPDILRRRLADLICNLRKMNFHILKLLVEGSPTEICVKDCSGITEEQFFTIFENVDIKSLVVLQLELCGQCRLDYFISEILAQPWMNLSNLSLISLKGARCLSDDGLRALARSAPALRSINLSHCFFLTHAGISILANSLGLTLRELYIDECQKIDAELILPALKNLGNLEVLSVAGNQTVSDLFVLGLISSCGEKLKELDFANCQALTNNSLEVIGKGCTYLHSLNISNLDKLTDLGLQYLADGCRSIHTFKLSHNTFSDEAIAAFLEASGECMAELSLNHVTLVGPCTALSLSKCCRKLLNLDLSWCRKITNEALGLIVDSCTSLKQVKLFGCTQITEVFLNGHSNSLVQIIGLSLTPLL